MTVVMFSFDMTFAFRCILKKLLLDFWFRFLTMETSKTRVVVRIRPFSSHECSPENCLESLPDNKVLTLVNRSLTSMV